MSFLDGWIPAAGYVSGAEVESIFCTSVRGSAPRMVAGRAHRTCISWETRLEGVRTLNSLASGVATPLRCVHRHRPSGNAGPAPAPAHAAAVSLAAWP